jgi:Ion channel
MTVVGAVSLVAGILLVLLALWDIFQTVVVPRPTPGVYRFSRYVIRSSWHFVRGIARRRKQSAQDPLLGIFGPAAAVLMLATWLIVLIVGYGLVLFALGDQVAPPVTDLGSALYLAAVSLTTVGFGDIVPTGLATRVAVVLAAAAGLGVVALVVTFLFSLYNSYQRREVLVISLQATAGAPPSAVKLLLTYAKLDLIDRLPEFFLTWKHWAAEVLDSHVAYPLLGYFRASHDNLSWISALGTVLDAACLVTTTIKGIPRGEAELCRRVGAHLVEDLSSFRFTDGVSVPLSRAEFDAACRRLAAAGYELEPPDRAWRLFEAARAAYADSLERMANYWATPATSWLGSHAPLRSPVHRAAREEGPPPTVNVPVE